jgi:hypothetical protein
LFSVVKLSSFLGAAPISFKVNDISSVPSNTLVECPTIMFLAFANLLHSSITPSNSPTILPGTNVNSFIAYID